MVTIMVVVGLDEPPVEYAGYAAQTQMLLSVFAAAQAPILFSRDLRYGSIVLYLARPLRSSTFALTRWASLTAALLVFLVIADPGAVRRRAAQRGRPHRADHGRRRGAGGRRAARRDARERHRRDQRLVHPARDRRGREHRGAAVRVRRDRRGAGRRQRAGRRSGRGVRRPAGAVLPLPRDRSLGARHVAPRPSPRRAARSWRSLYVVVALLVLVGGIAALDLALPQGWAPDDACSSSTSASRWYGNVVAVNDVSMRIGPGVTGLLGPNGAGKSTLIAMLSGFLAPSSGTATLDGQPIWRDIRSATARIGLVPERELSFDYLTGTPVRDRERRAPGTARPAAGCGTGDRRRRARGRRRPTDRHLLQGDAPAHQDRLRPGARPRGAAARRALQRRRPAAAGAADGAAAADGRRGSGPSCSAPTSWRRSSRSPARSRSWCRAGTPPPGTSGRSAG